MKSLSLVSFLGLLAACSAAKAPAEATAFTVELRAAAEEGIPLAGVEFAAEGKRLGSTGSDGRLAREIRGVEGSTLRVVATCPPEYEPPEQPSPLRLTRTRAVGTQAAQPLAVDVRCQKRLTSVAIVVRAPHGEQLPVLVDGRAVAQTDREGVAHLLLHRPRADKALQLGLDTTTRASLKPVNPTRTYELHGRDAVVLFEPSLVVSKPHVARAIAPRRRIPVRVD